MAWEEMFFRLGLIFIVSGVIGYDRQYKNKPAGIKTHILVGLGSGIITLVQVEANQILVDQAMSNHILANIFSVDSGRLTAQVVSGIGFLGAGTIIVTKEHVKGLTTAASLWATAMIGIAIGSGYLKLGLISSFFVFSALVVVNKCIRMNNNKQMKIVYKNFSTTQKIIEDTFQKEKVSIENCRFSFDRTNEENYAVIYMLSIPPNTSAESVAYRLRECEDIIKVSISEAK